jgi:hypothetical protein
MTQTIKIILLLPKESISGQSYLFAIASSAANVLANGLSDITGEGNIAAVRFQMLGGEAFRPQVEVRYFIVTATDKRSKLGLELVHPLSTVDRVGYEFRFRGSVRVCVEFHFFGTARRLATPTHQYENKQQRKQQQPKERRKYRQQ